jgi:hypothetical protein
MVVACLLILSQFSVAGNGPKLSKPTTPYKLSVTVAQLPNVDYAASVLALHTTSLAQRNNNPANLRWNGTYNVYPTLREGLTAMEWQIEQYQSGKSRHTSPTTTLAEYLKIYSPPTTGRYLSFMVEKLKVAPNTPIRDIPRDSLIKYHINMECHKLFKLLYVDRPLLEFNVNLTYEHANP